MAILNITEITAVAGDANATPVPATCQNNPAVQEVTGITATPQSSSVFSGSTIMIRLCSDVDVRYRLAPNPTAAATDTLLPANVVEIVGIPMGESYKISVRTA